MAAFKKPALNNATSEVDANLVLEKNIKTELFKYELAEQAIASLRANNSEIFEKLDRYEQEQEDIKDTIKRLLYTTDGPPAIVKIGQRTHTWASGEIFRVEVTYKKKSDYYDPRLLPVEVFALPGVVTEVDKHTVDAIGVKDKRVAKAFKQGEWMTPSVSVQRLTREAKTE